MRFIVMESHNGFTPGWIVVCVRKYELYQVYQPVKVECFSKLFKFVLVKIWFTSTIIEKNNFKKKIYDYNNI